MLTTQLTTQQIGAVRRTTFSRLSASSRSIAWMLLLVGAVAAWPVYVYGSSQVAWLAATILLAALGWDLSRRRSPLLAALLLGVVAVLGTEATGELAAGTAPLGSLRTLDAVVLAAVLPRLGEHWRLVKRPRLSMPVVLILSIAAYAVVMWALNGLAVDGPARADLRLAGLATLAWLALRGLAPWNLRWVARAVATVVLLTSAKAVALYLSGYWTIGTFDRAQASTVQPPGEALRIILVGGDTLMILAPACLLALGCAVRGRADRWLLSVAGSSACLALLISGTRSGLVIAALLFGVVAAFEAHGRGLAPVRWWAAAFAVAVLLAGGAIAMGVAQRFWQADAPATGLDFRKQEIQGFLDLPIRDLLLGQGFGGRYTGKNVLGAEVETGWSHSLPVFITAKIGVIGLVAVGVLLIAAALTTADAYRRTSDPGVRGMIELAAVAVVGTITMSLTLGRAALPEGAVILVLGLTMLQTSKGRTPCAH
ncbi:MAG: O-antigen ligase family protein [Thermoleophilia bacterium]